MDASTKKTKAGVVFKSYFAFLLCIVYLLPFALVLINSFKRKVSIVKHPLELLDDKGMQFVNYANAVGKMSFGRSFGNSLFITVFSVLILVVFSSMAAYFLVRHALCWFQMEERSRGVTQ